jgi:hypothetical protein
MAIRYEILWLISGTLTLVSTLRNRRIDAFRTPRILPAAHLIAAGAIALLGYESAKVAPVRAALLFAATAEYVLVAMILIVRASRSGSSPPNSGGREA